MAIKSIDDLYDERDEARYVARELMKLVRDMPAGLDEIDPDLYDFISSHDMEWLDK